MQLAVPREAIGRPAKFDFKWVDNLQQPGDIMDFYNSGDVAPLGRFNFRYQVDAESHRGALREAVNRRTNAKALRSLRSAHL